VFIVIPHVINANAILEYQVKKVEEAVTASVA
jgi:hypothetical protein